MYKVFRYSHKIVRDCYVSPAPILRPQFVSPGAGIRVRSIKYIFADVVPNASSMYVASQAAGGGLHRQMYQ